MTADTDTRTVEYRAWIYWDEAAGDEAGWAYNVTADRDYIDGGGYYPPNDLDRDRSEYDSDEMRRLLDRFRAYVISLYPEAAEGRWVQTGDPNIEALVWQGPKL